MQQHIWIFQRQSDQLPLLSEQTKVHLNLSISNNNPIFGIGDLIYFWRSHPGPSGIIASGLITALPAVSSSAETTLELTVLKYAQHTKQIIKADWLNDDPVLNTLPILSEQEETFFALEDTNQIQRLSDLWANTGRDWSVAESIAGLCAYHLT